ncbi:MAG: peptide chain release factor-like protein [Candidatus Omnitrophica bacterium]|nr:peptide chain release factor-like protein [Candidatus Omnitrophota bacterium]MBU2044151.1 peptide chain release factor-like protein [Candidatus Omnitrophota bacterium]MBU2250692.1 peptide chain release factor-like protein [Candidatus Omnitrophota bacterium]MBU2265470.1 peptide chain release factor-like protein [Candidatus Omnitrophota bacterium]
MDYADLPISRNKAKTIKEKMARLKIRESDFKEHFLRAGGRGGQKLNKTSSCVYLKHLPTGIEVKCQQERSQALNRFFARRILIEKIETLVLKEKSEKNKQIEKIRRQKRKRSKRAKEKILKAKHLHSEKKQFRREKPQIEQL